MSAGYPVQGVLGLTAAAGALGTALTCGATVALAAAPTVIELTQVPCQFVESENGVDRGYRSTQKADCEAINAQSGRKRVDEAQPMRLKAGSYVFRVTNKNVPYDLGFWLRGDGLINRTRLPSVSGGGLKTGATREYTIELEAGEYVYSCPLNTTPDYRLIVSE